LVYRQLEDDRWCEHGDPTAMSVSGAELMILEI
jgi:hypothetical protein